MDDIYNRVARRRHQGQRGFTLIELLVVIAILAVLAAIVIFNVTGVVNRGSLSACQTDAKSVQTASDAYFGDKSAYPSADGKSTVAETVNVASGGPLVPAYLHTTPGNGETFTYTDTTGTVEGHYLNSGTPTVC